MELFFLRNRDIFQKFYRLLFAFLFY